MLVMMKTYGTLRFMIDFFWVGPEIQSWSIFGRMAPKSAGRAWRCQQGRRLGSGRGGRHEWRQLTLHALRYARRRLAVSHAPSSTPAALAAECLQMCGLLCFECYSRGRTMLFMLRFCLVVWGTAVAAQKSKIQEWPSDGFWGSTITKQFVNANLAARPTHDTAGLGSSPIRAESPLVGESTTSRSSASGGATGSGGSTSGATASVATRCAHPLGPHGTPSSGLWLRLELPRVRDCRARLSGVHAGGTPPAPPALGDAAAAHASALGTPHIRLCLHLR